MRAIYDMNINENLSHILPHDALNQIAGIPPQQPIIPITAQEEPTLLMTIANFFWPRPITQQAPTPAQANKIFGDWMAIPIAKATTRLSFINLNGINLKKKAEKIRDLCKEMKSSDIDILAASEHNLDTNKFVVRQTLQDIARKTF
jgi:hypothetical protein